MLTFTVSQGIMLMNIESRKVVSRVVTILKFVFFSFCTKRPWYRIWSIFAHKPLLCD